MKKGTKTHTETAEHTSRLHEIGETRFGALSDDEVLGLLAERTRLLEAERELEARQREAVARLALEKKRHEEMEEAKRLAQERRTGLEKELTDLNRAIVPDKGDEELLTLIARRKELERQLGDLGQVLPPASAAEAPMTPTMAAEMPQGGNAAPAIPPVAPSAPAPEMRVPLSPSPDLKLSLRKEFGQEGIAADDFQEGSVFSGYLHQLKDNTGSLGTLLQGMPADAKKNKAFMLRVAEIDPAYAMHYADPETLKRDEDFNVRIAAMKNPRNSGNALAEMLPDARTSEVVLAAVKQDYRNIRFVRPDMSGYDEMMRIAKQAALEKVAALREAADIMLLIPRPLQQDAQFMQEIEHITASLGKEKTAI